MIAEFISEVRLTAFMWSVRRWSKM